MSDTKRGMDYARYVMEAGDAQKPPALLLEFSEIDAQGNAKTTVPLSREFNRTAAFIRHLGLEQFGDENKVVMTNATCTIRIQGAANCRKFAGYLTSRNKGGVNDAILAVIPDELKARRQGRDAGDASGRSSR